MSSADRIHGARTYFIMTFVSQTTKAITGLATGLYLFGAVCFTACVTEGWRTTVSSDKQDQTQPTHPPARATFMAVGDIMLSRGVARVIDRARDPLVPFYELESELLSSDFNFGNLESPVSGHDDRLAEETTFNARKGDITGLVKYKFKVVNLANNHALDQGIPGLRFTRAFLAQHGVEYLGVGDNQHEAWMPKVIEANGLKIGFIGASYASINDGGAARNNYVARIEDESRLRKAIDRAKLAADLVVVTMHAGIEYVRDPDGLQQRFARFAVDSGADIVIGAHPHWVQYVEEYRGKPIFYSLGNFIFDQRKPETMLGLMLKIHVSRADAGQGAVIDKIELLPVVSERMGIPRMATRAEARSALQRIEVHDAIYIPGTLANRNISKPADYKGDEKWEQQLSN